MATVSRRFRDNFETFSAHRIATGEFTAEDVAELKRLIQIDLTPGPDQLRKEVFFLNASGVKIPATIDDHEERYRYWAEFFGAEVEDIELQRKAA
jgi:HSP20 family molecular chaperone IbpA